jgi:hypothetical protein
MMMEPTPGNGRDTSRMMNGKGDDDEEPVMMDRRGDEGDDDCMGVEWNGRAIRIILYTDGHLTIHDQLNAYHFNVICHGFTNKKFQTLHLALPTHSLLHNVMFPPRKWPTHDILQDTQQHLRTYNHHLFRGEPEREGQ